MIGFDASPTELAAIRRGAISATLVLPSVRLAAGRVRALRRLVRVHDEDGNLLEERLEPVREQRGPGQEPRILVVTITAVDELDVYATEGEQAPTLVAARRCGWVSVAGLRAGWRLKHPRSPLATLAWFTLGDARDRPVFLNPIGSKVYGDARGYTSGFDALRAGEVLGKDEAARLVALNGQKDARRRADQARELSQLTAAQRMARIEAAGDRLVEEVRHELRIIAEEARRKERKLGLTRL